MCGQNAGRQNAGGQNTGGQNAGQICTGGQNADRFWGWVDKMPVSSNHISIKTNAKKKLCTNTLTQK